MKPNQPSLKELIAELAKANKFIVDVYKKLKVLEENYENTKK